ncbi:MAG: tyrosine-type recombinase/integrase [Oscillospiraceae bacterium]|nr:tyrosine-type recombinase/integrase [Oscillospiraceae bacterium]
MATDMKDCPDYLLEYIFYMRVIKNRSEKTIESYYIDLRLFLRYVKENMLGMENPDIIADVPFSAVEKITLADIYEYLNYSAEELKNNDKTRARKISALKSFYKAASSGKLSSFSLAKNPLLNLDVPSPKRAQPKYMNLDEGRRLLSSVSREDNFYERDFCMLMLFLNCGMRLSELVGINLNDIDLNDRTLRLLGKGNKERTIHINGGCAEAIAACIAARPETDEQALFLSKRKTRITGRRVEQIVTAAIDRIGLSGRGLSTHKLRHTAATLMYQYGNVDPMVLKEILGHANVSTTEIYTHLTNENVRAALESNPLADVMPK